MLDSVSIWLSVDSGWCKYPSYVVFFLPSPHVYISAAKSAPQGPELQPTTDCHSISDINHHSPSEISKIVFKWFLSMPAGLYLAFPDDYWNVFCPAWNNGLESVSCSSVLEFSYTPGEWLLVEASQAACKCICPGTEPLGWSRGRPEACCPGVYSKVGPHLVVLRFSLPPEIIISGLQLSSLQ